MDNKDNCFDAKTAQRIKKNVAGRPLSAFSDAAGNICRLGRGRLPGGGVAFNKAALAWLEEQQGGRCIRALNLTTGFDRLAALDDLPDGQNHYQRDDIVLDPEDFEEERFPPLPASGDDAPFRNLSTTLRQRGFEFRLGLARLAWWVDPGSFRDLWRCGALADEPLWRA